MCFYEERSPSGLRLLVHKKRRRQTLNEAKRLIRHEPEKSVRLRLMRSFALRPVSSTLFVFGLFVWLYVIAIQITHPEWLSGQFSHIAIAPFNWRLDEVGMIAFAVSAFGFFVWQLERTP
jgi:hypothetical protein